MKYIIEYKLWNKEVPFFVEDNGYFQKDGSFIGISRDDFDCYIPSDIKKLSKMELEERIVSLNIVIRDIEMNEKILSKEEKQELVKTFLEERKI